MLQDIFISHATDDASLAAAIADGLLEGGLSSIVLSAPS